MTASKLSVKILESRLVSARTSSKRRKYLILLGETLRFSDIERSNSYYREALKISREENDPHSESQCLNGVGINHALVGNSAEALRIFYDCLNFWEKEGNEDRIAASYNNLGIVLNQINKHEEALKYLQKSLTIKERQGRIEEALNNMQDIGVTMQSLGRTSEAEEIFNQVLNQATENGYILPRSNALNDLGTMAFNRKEYAQALSCFCEAREALRNTDYLLQFVRRTHNAGVACILMEQNDKARQFLEEALQICLANGFAKDESNSCFSLAELEGKEGNFKKAFSLFKRHSNLKKKLVNDRTSKKFTRIHARIKSSLIEQDLEIEELKNTQLKCAHEQLSKSQEDLLQRHRHADVGILTASIAHQINQPLQVMFENLKKLNLEVSEARLAQMEDCNRRIQSHGTMVNNVVTQLLEATSFNSKESNKGYQSNNVGSLVKLWLEKKVLE